MDPEQCTRLKAYLEKVPDPRQAQGQRYGWLSVLAILCLGLLSGQQHPKAIAQWSRLRQAELVAGLGLRRKTVPSEATLRRALQEVSVAQLEEWVGGFVQQCLVHGK